MVIAAWAAPGAERTVAERGTATGEVARLRRQLEARRVGLTTVEVVADLGPAELVEAAGEPDLEQVSRRQLAWPYPRDQRGGLQPRTVVTLTCCRRAAKPRGRQLWLCAEGPASRHEAERIRLRLRWEHGANLDHRWDEARHLRDVGCQIPDLDAAWAVFLCHAVRDGRTADVALRAGRAVVGGA